MPRTNQDGRDIKLVLSWLCKRSLSDKDLGDALGKPSTTFSNRKKEADYPSYEELEQYAAAFGVDARALQIAFGLRGTDEIVLLDDKGMREYIDQGGGPQNPPVMPTRKDRPPRRKIRYAPRDDTPPL